jgi:hypothetical protein
MEMHRRVDCRLPNVIEKRTFAAMAAVRSILLKITRDIQGVVGSGTSPRSLLDAKPE